MRSRSGKWAIALMVVLPLVLGLANGALAQDTPLPIELQVSPNVLNLESYGGSVSLHTDVGYSSRLVVDLAVEGEAVTPLYTFPDSRGQLVVKCSLATIKDIVEVGEATFVLTVVTPDGTWYEGFDTIKVISESGVSRKG